MKKIKASFLRCQGAFDINNKQQESEVAMSTASKRLMIALLIGVMSSLTAAFDASGDSSSSDISGRMAVTYDQKTGTATGMVAGYCQGEPVTIGPSTFAVAEWQFSSMKAEDAGKSLCGKDFSIKKVTKSRNNGREIVADVVLVRHKAE